jgi:amino acid adenylation domain-containing protein
MDSPESIRPALPHEQVLCLMQDLDPARPGLTLAMAFELGPECDDDALSRALLELVRGHDSLRARFVRDGEHWLRVVDPVDRVDLRAAEYCDRESIPAGTPATELVALLAHRCREYLDLSAGPLFHATVVVGENGDVHLVVRAHHAVVDLWAVGLLLRDLAQLYKRETTPDAPGPAPVTQKPSTAMDQRKADRAYQFWQGLWSDGHDPLHLPRANSSAIAEDGRARATARCPVDFGEARSAQVTVFAKELGVTRFAVLFAAQVLALARLGASTRTPIAVSMHGRRATNAESVEYALSTVVMPVSVDAETIAEFVTEVSRMLRGALVHQGMGYPELVERTRGEPGPEMPPPETTLAMFQDPRGMTGLGAGLLGGGKITVGGMTMRTIVPPVAVGPWHLVTALAGGDRLFGFVDVDPAHHPAWLADQFAGTFIAAVDAMTSSPDLPVADLDVVAETDHARLAAWSAAPAEDGPSTDTLHGLVLASAQRYPERIAVVARDGSLTYQELVARSAAIAAELDRRGVPPGSTVGVLLTRQSHLVPALLGVLRAGCAYVGLDAAAPAARLADILDQAQSRLVLVDSGTVELAAPLSVQSLIVDESTRSARAPERTIAPQAPAYLMFTSGSTGRPKGVVIGHHSAVNLIRFGARRFTAAELGETLAVSGIHFDLSVWELFLPLAGGHQVRLLENALALADLDDPSYGTFLSSVPSAVAACANQSALPPGLRLITMGGDVITGGLVRQIAQQCPQARIVAMYGPTETTTYMTFAEVSGATGDPVPIGRPFGGTTLRVVDENLRDVPVGAVGELLIGGPCVALGYAGKPAMTAARFLPDPDDPRGRLYRSGDLVRWRQDGLLDFVGRVDHQVKIRGFRIELGEVEACLHKTVALREVVVHPAGTELARRLVAYLVPAEPIRQETADWLRAVREGLSRLVPGYMVPTDYVVLDELPKNRNGKPDRQRLARLPAIRMVHGDSASLSGSVRQRLARLWRQLLEVDSIGAADDFFEAGGHSLLLARLAQLVAEEFDVDIQLAALWEARTIAAQEELVEARAATEAPARRPIPRLDRTRPANRSANRSSTVQETR